MTIKKLALSSSVAIALWVALFLASASGVGETTVDTVSVTTSQATASEYLVTGRGGVLIVPTGSSITTVTYYTAEKAGGTRVPLNDSAGAAVTQTVAAANAYDMPASIYGCRVLYLKGNAAGPVFVTSRN